MAVKTYTEQLESVQAAIEEIETTGQSSRFSDKALTRGDLSTLYAREKYLRRMAARETRGGIRVKYGTPTS